LNKKDKLKDILLITPPFTQLNTPYPATPYLKGFLNTKGIDCYQIDLGIEVINQLFTKHFLNILFEEAFLNKTILSENSKRIYALKNEYLKTIEPVIQFLQGKNPTLGREICAGKFLPQASRFDVIDDLEWAFGIMGMQDKAKHLATLYLEDLSDFIVECVDEHFGFSRYAERLGRSANSFDELFDYLQKPLSIIENLTIDILKNHIEKFQPKFICFSVPFPGNLTAAFRCCQFIKEHYSSIKTAMGGGFANTELRSITETKVFHFFDFITLDDGELPIEILIENVLNNDPKSPNYQLLKRTFLLENGKVVFNNFSLRNDYKQLNVGTPDYSDLLLDQYISVIEVANPMHSLWSDGRWNKLTMAHGCYWGKCTFCDTSLDYIKLYEPIAAKTLVDKMEQLIAQTGENGFHFVDEAAPPALMRDVALEILNRNLVVTWWTNIRFEKSFTKDLCSLLKASGCVAVSGGLEVASDRLLALIQKGVTVEQVAQVTHHFTEAGIMVHAYLMYGYPTQTEQETIDSLEMVRQLFEFGVIQSGFWHQFALTAHSPIGLEPEKYKIVPDIQPITFANNDVQFKDKTGINHEKYSFGLKKSLYNFMHGICFELPLQDWFDNFRIPKTKIPKDFIRNCIASNDTLITKSTSRIICLGNSPYVEYITKNKKGRNIELIQLQFHTQDAVVNVSFEKGKGEWLVKKMTELHISKSNKITFSDLKQNYEEEIQEDFELFWYSKGMDAIKEIGLLVL